MNRDLVRMGGSHLDVLDTRSIKVPGGPQNGRRVLATCELTLAYSHVNVRPE